LGVDYEHRWIRFACSTFGHLFPYLPGQPWYHARRRRNEPARHGNLGGARQWIESV